LINAKCIYPALFVFDQSNYTGWIYFSYLYTVIDRNNSFSGTSVACYLLGFGNLVVISVYFLLIEHTMHQCIILLFNINVDG